MEKTKSESEMNEGEILTLAESFKDLVKVKNEEIIELRKIVMMSYAIFRMLDEEIDHHDLVERGRSLTSDALNEWVIRE